MSHSQALASSSKGVLDEVEGSSKGEINQRGQDALATQDVEDNECDSCLICLGDIIDQSVLPKCQHSLFCFDCIIKWISIHRRCPLCSTSIEDYIIHSIRSDDDYIRHYLPKIGNESRKDADDTAVDPLRLQADLSQTEARRIRRQLQQRITRDQPGGGRGSRASTSNREASSSRPEWGQVRVEERQRDAIAHWDQRLAFRRGIYRQELYCLHIGSNSTSKLTPPSSHSIISSSPLIESTLLSFIRRELLAFPQTLDVDWLSRYTIHIFKSFDCKSNEAIDLLAEFLGKSGSSHFCHEVYSFSRFIGQASARQRDKVKAFDEWAQYRTKKASRAEERMGTATKVVSQVEGKVLSSLKELDDLSSSDADARFVIRQSREKLLQRLEEEKIRHKDSSKIEAGRGDIEPLGDTSSDREKTLKEKLLLQKREATLRSQAREGLSKRAKT
jgi:hypothetical protein